MFSFVGETVLDPFLGSGTTTKVARELKRNSIGYEINKSFLPIIEQKIGKNDVPLFDTKDGIEILFQSSQDYKKANQSTVTKKTKSSTICNRVHHPEHWKEIQRK